MKTSIILIISILAFILTTFIFTNSAIPPQEKAVTVDSLPHHTYLPVLPEKADFCGERVPLEREEIRESLDREILTNTFWHTNMILVLKRSGKYFPMIEKILAEQGVPDDFKYLCVAESSLNPLAKSPSNAVGFWQILETTGKELGLEINSEVDERYNIEKSTVVACEFLKKSYEIFGSWTLVAASYNGGKRRVSSNIRDQKQESYYDVLWAEETARYVFRILAFKEIMSAPEKYGYFLTGEDYYKPENYRTDTIKGAITDFAQYAIDNGTTYKRLKNLNPWLRQNYLTNARGKSYLVRIPE